MKKYTIGHIGMLAALLAVMLAAVIEIKGFLKDQIVELEEQDQCWFLTPKVEAVLVNDLVMWVNHMNHNPDAQPEEWFDLRQAELVELYKSKGITEKEAFECLTSLEPPTEDIP